jgi:hypothetical protein
MFQQPALLWATTLRKAPIAACLIRMHRLDGHSIGLLSACVIRIHPLDGHSIGDHCCLTTHTTSARRSQGKLGSWSFLWRKEHSVFVPAERDREKWEEQYGNLHPAEQAVVFIGGDPQSPRIVAVPSGGGKRDLASLVSDIVSIQAMELPAQVDGASLSVDSVWLLCSIAFRPTPL